jgi:hypothetical protein
MPTHDLSCDDVEARDYAARYAAGVLESPELEDFEAHLIACARCQSIVRSSVGLRRALQSTAQGERRRSVRPIALAGLAVAASTILLIGGVMLRDRSAIGLRDLGRLDQPPIYLGVPVRASAQPAESTFARAMSAYAAGRYGDAAAGLNEAARRGAPVEPTTFFYGASLLMLDQPSQARDAFARVIAAGDNPYSAEAHYYRALAVVRLGDADGALADLRAIAGGESDPAPAARTLIAKLEARRSTSR